MKNKEVKFSHSPQTGKNVKVSNNPESYKTHNICWQFSLMDFEFEFGWENVINRIQFTHQIKEQIAIKLMENECNDDIYSIIDGLKTSEYNDYHSFFKKLRTIPEIKTTDLLSILELLKKNFFWHDLYPKLKDFETKKWFELENEKFGKNGKSKHHLVSINKIIPSARDRLTELNLDDIEDLFSIRLTSTQRIWGIRNYNYFKILWFDFDHNICPSNKD
jgi:hypothetical protein